LTIFGKRVGEGGGGPSLFVTDPSWEGDLPPGGKVSIEYGDAGKKKTSPNQNMIREVGGRKKGGGIQAPKTSN